MSHSNSLGRALTVTKNLPYSPSLAMKLYMSAASWSWVTERRRVTEGMAPENWPVHAPEHAGVDTAQVSCPPDEGSKTHEAAVAGGTGRCCGKEQRGEPPRDTSPWAGTVVFLLLCCVHVSPKETREMSNGGHLPRAVEIRQEAAQTGARRYTHCSIRVMLLTNGSGLH